MAIFFLATERESHDPKPKPSWFCHVSLVSGGGLVPQSGDSESLWRQYSGTGSQSLSVTELEHQQQGKPSPGLAAGVWTGLDKEAVLFLISEAEQRAATECRTDSGPRLQV